MDHGRSTIEGWLKNASQKLEAAGIPSARLDAEIILADALGVDRAWLIAHGSETHPPESSSDEANLNLARRLQREPLAYIRGFKEFYGRDFMVTPDVLIPRPESEALIELLKSIDYPPTGGPSTVIDIGTGSGALAVTAALEIPSVTVYASDISPAALGVARRNAQRLSSQVEFHQSDLLTSLPSNVYRQASILLANLPYVDRHWQRSAETSREPELALFADDRGLSLIKKLIRQADEKLISGSYLLLEADPRQHPDITELAERSGFELEAVRDYALRLRRL